jgi:hypothetical protein
VYRSLLVLSLLSIALVGKISASENGVPNVDDVVSPGRSLKLTSEQVVALKATLSKKRIQTQDDITAELPRRAVLAGVRYSLISPLEANGRPTPYTQATFVCRLNDRYDIVVIEDDRAGSNIVRHWIIRDLSNRATRVNGSAPRSVCHRKTDLSPKTIGTASECRSPLVIPPDTAIAQFDRPALRAPFRRGVRDSEPGSVSSLTTFG